MKKLLFIFLLVLPSALLAQSGIQVAAKLNADKVLNMMDSSWRYINADDTAMARPDYNDSNWATIYPQLKGDSGLAMLKGIGWFRKQVYVTDSIQKLPLALNMGQYGASEIYIDGKLLGEFGKIGTDGQSTEYYNPVMQPVIFHFDDTGWHTIAIRYANYRTKPQADNEDYFHGFNIDINEANDTYETHSVMRMIMFSIFIGLAFMFATLAGLHFLLWLFRKADMSNIFLSILCGIFCIWFIMSSYWPFSTDPDVFIHRKNTTVVLFAIALVALSALLNYLFARINYRLLIVVALCIVSVVCTFNDVPHQAGISSLVMLIIMGEACVLVIKAVRKKVKGAKILAFGIVPLTITSLALFVVRLYTTAEGLTGDAQQSRFGLLMIVGLLTLLMLISFSAIPFSMSAFLAWRFASVSKDLGKQLEQVKELSEKTQQQEAEKKRILENQKAELEKEVAERTREIIEEKKKSDDLLHNILPQEVASELKERGATTAHHFDHVTVLFTDFVDFTIAGERMGSEALVEELHSCFKVFDGIMSKYGIEKIKTIGDAYMAVCGLPKADALHAEKVVAAAEEIRTFVKERRAQLGDKTFEIRIGIHSGEVVAGIVGVKKFAYDIWGDTVNTAARMEQNSEPGKINISQTTYDLVKHKYTCTYRGELDAKNKGKLKMYFVE